MRLRTIPRIVLSTLFVALIAIFSGCSSSDRIILRGACQFDESHAYTRTLRYFEERVALHYGKPIEFELYLNSELGLEKDFFAYMSQGISVDYAIVSPSHMSTFSKAGREAGAYGRKLESSEDSAILAQMENEGKLNTHEFSERAELLKRAAPEITNYAKEIGAEDVVARIRAIN